MSARNRAEGWQHAKITGHSNEECAKAYAESELNVQKRILDCYGCPDAKIESIEIGGLHETSVDSIFGDKTKSKPDMHVHLKDGRCINISIKKSTSGQVFLITPDRFIKGFEFLFKKIIPEDVKKAINLFWGTDPDTTRIAKQIAGPHLGYELEKGRLVHETLADYNQVLDKALLKWFNDNIVEIFEFCFTKGLARDPKDWADIIWYINLVDNDVEIDEMFTISDIANNLKRGIIEYGNKGGGTTIQLPFGFVQWHDPGKKGKKNLQFHHNYDKIKTHESLSFTLNHTFLENRKVKRYELFPDEIGYAMVAEDSEIYSIGVGIKK